MNKKLFFLIPLLFLLTGCWNYQELNTLAISTAMAIDKVDDEYEVSILIANSKKSQVSSKEGESQTIVYSAKGENLSDALKNIDLENPRQTYIGHLSVIVISEDIAKEGLINTLDLLLRNPESTKRFYLAIAKDYKAKEIIKIISPLETFPSQTISSNIRSSSESQAVSVSITYSKFIENLMKTGIEPTLPTITIEGDAKDGEKDKNIQQASPEAILKLSTLSIFKDDKLLGYATKDESRGINLLAGKINEMIIPYKCEENYLITSLSELHTNIKITFEDNKPIANVYLSGNGDITENNCNLNLTDKEVISKIQKEINKQIKKLINKGLSLLQDKYKTDVIGFGNLIYKKNPKYFKNISDWNNDEFPNLKVNIKTNINIITKGSARQSIKEAINENKNI